MAFYLPLIVFLVAIHVAFAQVDPCMNEIQKTEVLYELCVKFDRNSTGYVDCIKLYMEQRIRTNEVCNIYQIPPAPWELYRPEPPENTCLAPEQEAPPVPASYEDEPEELGGEEGVRFGLRAGFNINDFSFGYKDLNRKIGMGYGFGGGLVLNVPVASILRFNLGLDLYYRLLFDGDFGDTDEAVVSVPILLQIGKTLYFTTGVQLDFPTSLTKKGKGNADFMDNRASMDVGIVAGLSYMSTNFGLDFRYVYGLTSLFKNFSHNNIYYKKDSSLGQYGFGVSYFF